MLNALQLVDSCILNYGLRTIVCDAYLAVLGNFDLQELKLEFLVN